MCYCPTPTLHLNLALTRDGAFLLSPQKTHTVWFISVLNYGDTENVLINHLLLVIPMLYPCHYTNLCPHKPHKHAQAYMHTDRQTHTHTHTQTETLTHTQAHMHTDRQTHTHTLSHMHIHTHTLSHMHTHTHSLTCTHTHTHTHTLSHMHTHTHTLSHMHTHTLSLSHTHTHTHTHKPLDTLPHTHTHTHTLFRTHTHTHTHALSHTHTLSLSHTHTPLWILLFHTHTCWLASFMNWTHSGKNEVMSVSGRSNTVTVLYVKRSGKAFSTPYATFSTWVTWKNIIIHFIL